MSSEKPEAIRYFGFKFFGDQWGLCITTDPVLAALCDLPFPSNPPPAVLPSSSPQTCTVECGGMPVSYTAVAGSFVAMSQADADSQAYALACLIAQILCDGGTYTIYTNTAQSCSISCADGRVSAVTMPVGVAQGLSQQEANLAALALACAVADVLCNQDPNILPFPNEGAGTSIPMFYFRNTPQSCNVNCPGGGVFTHVIPGDVFYGDSPANANAIAASYACNPASYTLACLSSIGGNACAEMPYAELITVSGFTSPTWALVAGALPFGVTFSDGILSGIALATGTFSFTVRATQGSDYTQRTYTLTVREITTGNPLPAATQNTPYAVAFTEDGFTSPTWSVSLGSLPDGLILNPNSGILSGTATENGGFDFSITATEDGIECSKEYSLTVAAVVTDMQYWDYEELSGNRIDAIQGAVMVPFTVATGAVNRVAGKVNFGVQLLVGAFGLSRLQQNIGTGFPFAIASGITVCGWVKVDTLAVDGMDFGFYTGESPHGFQLDLGVIEVSGNWYLYDAISSSFSLISPLPMGVYTFFILELLTDSTLQLELNRSGVFEGTTVPTPSEGAAITLVMEMADLNEGDFSFDEIGFFPRLLTIAEKNYLYAGGAGRGTPLTLP